MVKCCKYPFERVNIEYNGQVTFCCPAFNNEYMLGNIYEDSFEDMWFGEKAQEFRKAVLDGSYKYCNLDFCQEFKEENFSNFEDKDIANIPYPKTVHLSYVWSCNTRCQTCRDELYVESNDTTIAYNKISDKIINICKNAELIYLNGSGEVFTSNHLKSLIKSISEKYPNAKFELISNGLLFDEKHVKDFGLEGKLKGANISIHAATKKTYEFIVRGGHWEQLQKNLKYLSELKKQGKIKTLCFNFVFHSLNFKEMPAFVKLANRFGAEAHFWRFRKWHDKTRMLRNYDRYTCWEPDHPDYNEFIKILGKLKGMSGYVLNEAHFRKLQSEIKDPWWVGLKNKIFKK